MKSFLVAASRAIVFNLLLSQIFTYSQTHVMKGSGKNCFVYIQGKRYIVNCEAIGGYCRIDSLPDAKILAIPKSLVSFQEFIVKEREKNRSSNSSYVLQFNGSQCIVPLTFNDKFDFFFDESLRKTAQSNKSVFFIGDSVSERIFQRGLLPLLSKFDVHCIDDPLRVSSQSDYPLPGVLCNHASGHRRVGKMRHWGVNPIDSDYLENWVYPDMGQINDTKNSPINIIRAVEEFQRRTADDSFSTVVFMFLSSMWDVSRYLNKYSGGSSRSTCPMNHHYNSTNTI